MRLWKLQDLFDDIHKHNPKAKKHLRLIHVCEKCNWRTPELAPLFPIDFNKNVPAHAPQIFEIKNHGYCDKCNQDCWQEIKNHIEYQNNNCVYCGGGRCKHYIE